MPWRLTERTVAALTAALLLLLWMFSGAMPCDGAAAPDTAWRCRDRPSACSVLYHAFVPPAVAASLGSSSAATVAPLLSMQSAGALWSAVLSAQTIRAAYAAAATTAGAPPFRVVLATNIPRAALSAAGAAFAAADPMHRSRLFRHSAATPPSDYDVRIAELLRAAQRHAQAVPGEVRFASAWPFDEYALYPAATAYTLKAIAMNATAPADVVSAAPPSILRPVRVAVGAAAVGGGPTASPPATGFARTLYLDSDTIILGPIDEALDALAAYDVAMVAEYASHHALSAGLYGAFFDAVAPDVRGGPYVPYVQTDGGKPSSSKRNKKQLYGTHAAYETQFNTGLVAFRSSSPAVLALMIDWEGQHLARPRCAADRVAWDQCSLPWALRRVRARSSATSAGGGASVFVRVGVLPSRFDVREALGRGCSGPSYDAMGASANPAKATVLHAVGNKKAMAEFITEVFFAALSTA